ncbi:tyrosine-type recombinase/integrase [Sphingomonas daechungensis]|uniref:tyrosine-type recombinase/integrase n=1 Tax=Sphingomonas daechungensis TaxID=1176646 RepID=UPI003784D083
MREATVPKLTATSVKHAKPGRHSAGEGLYLLVSESGAKSWVLRVQFRGRRRDIGLGSIAELSLSEAKDKARELRKVAKIGRDPIAARDKVKIQIPTFEDAAKACHEARSGGWEERHANAFLSSLKQHAFPRIGRLFVDSVDEKDILAVLSPIWQDKPAAARKLRQRINTVLDFAKGHAWRSSGAPRDSLRPLLAKQARSGNFSAMPYAEVPSFVTALLAKSQTVGRMALLFTILTAARSGEVRSARWSHIDLETNIWTRPAGLMKSREVHLVTLSPAAVAVLREATKLRADHGDTLIFPGARRSQLSDMTLLKIVKAEAGNYTVHGFRASFRTWAAEQMPTVPEAVAEAALAHSVPDAVVRAYQRANFLDLRRKLLDAWADFLEQESRVIRLVG